MADALPLTAARRDRAFPTLTDAQFARLAASGQPRHVVGGEVLTSSSARAVSPRHCASTSS
jgi:hypothetical protein